MERRCTGEQKEFKEIRIIGEDGSEQVIKEGIVFSVNIDEEGFGVKTSIVNVTGIKRIGWMFAINQVIGDLIKDVLGNKMEKILDRKGK